MKLPRRTRIEINLLIVFISIFIWVLLIMNPGHIMTIEHCHVSDSGPSGTSLKMLLDMNPFSSQLVGWGLMVIAMMLPKLITPIQHIYKVSFRRRRFLSALLFVLGYLAVWMIAGIVLIIARLALQLLMPNSYYSAIGLGIIATIWQFSPIKQQYLNRGHDHKILAAYGWQGYQDALFFGVMHGVYCVGAGWAIMLFPMLLPHGHNLAMIIVTFIMLSEHLEHPQVPRWRISFPGKLARVIIAQTQLKLKQQYI